MNEPGEGHGAAGVSPSADMPLERRLSAVMTGPEAIRFEVTDSPWFGPKSRGRDMLADAGWRRPVSPEEFLGFLAATYPDIREGVQFVRFHDCFHRDKGGRRWRQAFAIISTHPSARFRTALFDDARSITAATGWYPLVMGRRVMERRLAATRMVASRQIVSAAFGDEPFGELREVTDLAGPEGGCALGLDFEGGILALDFGFGFVDDRRIRGGLLSHQHRDHALGLVATRRRIPVLASPAAAMLVRRMRGNAHLLPVDVPSRHEVGDLFVDVMPGRHVPGSVVYRMEGAADEIVYSGDYCLANSHIVAPPDALVRLFRSEKRRRLLLDATFVGHEPRPGEIRDLRGAHALVAAAHQAGRSVVYVSDAPDPLLPAYLTHFRTHASGGGHMRRPLVVDEQVIWQLERTFAAFILRRSDAADPYVEAHYGRSMANYLESVWLYPSRSSGIPDGPADYFILGDALHTHSARIGPRPLLLLLGRAPEDWQGEIRAVVDGAEAVRLVGADFSFHSSERDVRAIAAAAVAADIEVVLFHNFPRRLRRAFRDGPTITLPTRT